MRNVFLRSTVCVTALVLGSPALSQTATPDQSPPAAPNPEPQPSATRSVLASTPESSGVGDIIVTAQRRSEKLKDVPLTVTSLSSTELVRNGVTSINQLSTLVSGFTTTGNGNIASPAIRGISTTISGAGVENPNAVYVDGVYNVSQYSLNSDIPDIDRIEVLKGPQGTLFGRNATGGAIQIFTKNPSFDPHANITIEEGAYTGSGSSRASNHFKVSAFATVPLIKDIVAISLAGGASRTEGYFTNDITGKRDGLIDGKTVRGKILVKPTSNLSIQATGFYLRNQFDGQVGYQQLGNLTSSLGVPGAVIPTKKYHITYNTDGLGVPDFGPPNGNIVTQYGGNLKVGLTLDVGTLTSLTAYTRSKFVDPLTSVQGNFCPASALATFQCLLAAGGVYQKETSQELNFVSRDFGILSFTTGAYYYHGRGDTITYLQFGLPVFNAHYDTKSYAGYGEATIKPTDSLSLIAGVRYTDERQHDFNRLSPVPPSEQDFTARNKKWTPRVSIRYAVTPELNAYATYSIGYKSGLTGAFNRAAIVKPEQLTSYEAGLKYGSKDLSVNIAFFYYDYKDLQVSGLDSTLQLNLRNADARLYGLDADVTAALSDAWRVRGALSYLPHAEYRNFTTASYPTPIRTPTGTFYQNSDPTAPPSVLLAYPSDLSGTRLVRAPKLTGSGTISYDNMIGNGRLDASATVTYSGSFDQELSRVIKQHSYALFSVQAGYRPGDGPLRVGVYGRNLGNKAYQINAVASGFGFLQTFGAPRELGVSLGYTF